MSPSRSSSLALAVLMAASPLVATTALAAGSNTPALKIAGGGGGLSPFRP